MTRWFEPRLFGGAFFFAPAFALRSAPTAAPRKWRRPRSAERNSSARHSRRPATLSRCRPS